MGIFDKFEKKESAVPLPEKGPVQISLKPWDKGYKILNRYEILDIKKGGMGIVYIAQDHELDQKFAIKTFQDQFLWNETIIQRFLIEAETWTNLERHTNIVFANIIQKIEGKPLLFLEHIDSGDLSQFIGKLGIAECLDFAIQFCTGMEYAYQKLGVIHRDIKPGNVMVQKDPRFRSGYCFKVSDFGLVKALGAEFEDMAFEVSTGLGTILYMPPEQFPENKQKAYSYSGKVTTRSDIYAFGVTLYQILTGRLPFTHENQIFLVDPEHPKYLNPAIPEYLDTLVVRCLEKIPDKRYSNFTELKEDLIRIFNGFSQIKYTVIGKKEDITYADWSNRGGALAALGKNSEAIGCFDTALKIYPGSAEVWNNKGIALGHLGKTQEAIVCYDKALEINPRESEPWNSKGAALDKLGKYKEAIICYDKALEINQGFTFAWSNKGITLGKMGRNDDAIRCFNKALEINPRFVLTWNSKGILLAKLGKIKEAIICYDKALEINPRYAKAWNNKGIATSDLGKKQEAIDYYNKALEINPGYAGAWYNKGITLGKLRKHQEATGCFEKALEINPRFAEVWTHKGISLVDLGKFSEAIVCFDKTLEINPGDYGAWNNKGIALANLGKMLDALGCFEKAIEINPRNPEGLNNKKNALVALGEIQKTIAPFDRALEINPRDATAWHDKGVALANHGKMSDALGCFDKALEINPRYAEAWYTKGFFLRQSGKPQEAIPCFEQFIRLAPPEHALIAVQAEQIIRNLRRVMEFPDTIDKHDVIAPLQKIGPVQNNIKPWKKGYKILNRHEILDIKEGGMGIVYIVYDHEWDRKFAIKKFKDQFLSDENAIQRFMAEAEIWTKLERHTNIVFADFIEKIEGKPMLFLEYIDSGDLGQFIGKFGIAESLDFAIQFCTGMEYAYQKLGVIHRDIKPGNVMVQKDSRFRSGYCFKVTDFGLVKALGADFKDKAFEVSTGLGTILYMPPEQFPERYRKKYLLSGNVTTRSDIYSFGVTLYQLLTGRLPFQNEIQILTQYPTHPKSVKPAIPENLDTLIVRCLDKNPETRYANFTELKKDLIRIFNEFTQIKYTVIGINEDLTNIDWLNRGVALSSLGKFHEAITCIEKSLAMDSFEPRAWHDKGNTLVWLNQIPEGIRCLDRALEIYPKYAIALCKKGIALGKMNNYNESIKWFDKALEIDPNYTEALAWKGLSLGCLQRFQEAMACFDKALQINPKDPTVLRNKGGLLGTMGRYQEACRYIDKALEINPRDTETLVQKGMILYSLGKPAGDALPYFNKALALDPDKYIAWYCKGVALAEIGNRTEAIHCLEKHIELFPPDLFQSGVTATVEQSKQIIRDLKGSETRNGAPLNLRKNPDSTGCSEVRSENELKSLESLNIKGIALASRGQFSEALAWYEKALEINPSDAGILSNKGNALAGLGKFSEAIIYHDKALVIDTRNADIWNNKGSALNNLGQFSEAIVCYDTALKINPQLEGACCNKGIALTNLGKFSEAIAYYDIAITINPKNTGAWLNKGLSLVKLGNHREALKHFNMALALNPKEYMAWYGKGLALANTGIFQEAILSFEKFISLAPPQRSSDIEQAKQIIRLLRGRY